MMVGCFLMTAGLFCGAEISIPEASHTSEFVNYSEAWKAAKADKRPMLVVLNPGDEKKAMDVHGLRNNEQLSKVLDEFVVAEIDTTTDHGQQVLKSFGNPTLPRMVVIDAKQTKQVFATSEKVSEKNLKSLLEKQLSSKEATTSLNVDLFGNPKPDCPMCKLKAMQLAK
jgi:ribosomal silencing factor RsfS